MKKLVTILAAVLLTATLWAQSPEKMSYQAVVRNSSNQLMTNQVVGMQICILQGSVSGTIVYTETQMPTTNANGLVGIEIGTGTVQNGNFANINWANGPYFIKTEIDPTGGTTYTIIGTSQLLSVPYALHAKTAENFTGTITEIDPVFVASVASGITASDTANWNNNLNSYTETDPVYLASQAKNITATHITNLGNLSGINTGDQNLNGLATKIALTDSTALLRSQMPVADGSETKVTAGLNIQVTGTGTTATPYVVNTTDTLKIGDKYQDGIVFWVDATGRHGLIAASKDHGDEVLWYNDKFRITGAMGDGVYAGAMNTTIIVSTQIADAPEGVFAAKVCSCYPVGLGTHYTYGDWYLPSAYELNLLYKQVRNPDLSLDNTANYWSSTETLGADGEKYAWFQDFSDGNQYKDGPKDKKFKVRAIRAF